MWERKGESAVTRGHNPASVVPNIMNSLWWALHHCRQLEKLDVSQNRRLTGQVHGVPFVVMWEITNPVVQCFYMASPSLLTVSLQECGAVTDDGIALLAKNCPNLRSLNISKCCQLSGQCLHAVAKVSRSVLCWQWYLLTCSPYVLYWEVRVFHCIM